MRELAPALQPAMRMNGGPAFMQPMPPYAAPHPMMPGAPPMYAPSPQYEFGPHEDEVIGQAAGRTKLWGIVSTVVGALQVLVGLLALFGNPLMGLQLFVPGIIAIVVGIVFTGAGNSLGAIVDTRGNDIQNLLRGLQKLGSAFTIQVVVAILGAMLGVVAFVIGFMAAFLK
ncbi:MAG TPA: hypothetical protein VFB62_19635 [Polyangiaceae bacterium]|nr:hypothetical protein [Polyangiaceae bacterium]